MKLCFWVVGKARAQVLRLGGAGLKPRPMNSGEALSLGASPSALSLSLVPRGNSAASGAITLSLSWTVTQSRNLGVYVYLGAR